MRHGGRGSTSSGTSRSRRWRVSRRTSGSRRLRDAPPARRLAAAPVWREVVLVASSPESKAVATAEPIAAAARVPFRIEPDLREIVRPPPPVLDARAHRERVRRYLAAEAVNGWEPADSGRARFERCVERLAAETRGPFAAVSHGTVLALYLRLTPEEWAAIALPAVAVADPQTRTVVEPFHGLDAFLARTRG